MEYKFIGEPLNVQLGAVSNESYNTKFPLQQSSNILFARVEYCPNERPYSTSIFEAYHFNFALRCRLTQS